MLKSFKEKFNATQIIVLVSIILILILCFVGLGLHFKRFTTDFLLNIVMLLGRSGTVGISYELIIQNGKKLKDIERKLDDLSVNRNRGE